MHNKIWRPDPVIYSKEAVEQELKKITEGGDDVKRRLSRTATIKNLHRSDTISALKRKQVLILIVKSLRDNTDLLLPEQIRGEKGNGKTTNNEKEGRGRFVRPADTGGR